MTGVQHSQPFNLMQFDQPDLSGPIVHVEEEDAHTAKDDHKTQESVIGMEMEMGEGDDGMRIDIKVNDANEQ